MERILILLQRLYWIILGLIVLAFGLVNRDILGAKREFDLIFGRFNLHVVWFVVAFLVAFLLEILISRSLLAATKRKAERLSQELAQLKASVYDREQSKLKEVSAKPEAATEAPQKPGKDK